jgi:hypothetical protein
MRTWLLVALVACGKGSSGQSGSAICSGSAATTKACVMLKFDEFTRRMCACSDPACTKRVEVEYRAWGNAYNERAAREPADEITDPDEIARSAQLMAKFAECSYRVEHDDR